jgi:isopentenyl phosphate kinase
MDNVKKKTLTVIKLGGALLTEKSIPYTTRNGVVPAVVREIQQCREAGLIEDLIVIHGVGSYGHPPVLEYKLHKGFKEARQLLDLSTTQQSVNSFRMELASEFIQAGVPVNLIHLSSFCVSDKGTFQSPYLEALTGFLSLGMVPLVGGDMVYDRSMGFSVGSGDFLAVFLAKALPVSRLIFATDVDGIYTADPKIDPSAPLLKRIEVNKMEQVLKDLDISDGKDASGAMRGKLQAIKTLEQRIHAGLDVSILSMLTPGNLEAFLTQNLSHCTQFMP